MCLIRHLRLICRLSSTLVLGGLWKTAGVKSSATEEKERKKGEREKEKSQWFEVFCQKQKQCAVVEGACWRSIPYICNRFLYACLMGDWVIGALINIVGSVAINFGTNLLKLGHDQVDITCLWVMLLVLIICMLQCDGQGKHAAALVQPKGTNEGGNTWSKSFFFTKRKKHWTLVICFLFTSWPLADSSTAFMRKCCIY